MLTLLAPSALLALLGLLLPLAIHLWNRRPGREVAVGSLRWLAAGANRRLRNLKLEQLGLLALRAALLALLVLALAGPEWRQALPAGRGQVLLSPELLDAPALAALRPGIDSLQRRGYHLRWLAPGFPKLSALPGPAASLQLRDSARQLSRQSPGTASYQWARVEQAAALFAGQPLYVLTPAALRSFQGRHRPLPAGISWQTVPAGQPSRWLQAWAPGPGPDSLQLQLGRSTETHTSFRQLRVAGPKNSSQLIPVPGLAPLRYQANPDGSKSQVLVSARDTAAPAVAGQGPPLVVVVYTTPEYAADARYLQAALRAAALGFFQFPLVKVVSAPPQPGTGNWVFWLSAAPLPAGWQAAVRQGSKVWRPAAGAGAADTSHVALGGPGARLSAVFRRGQSRAIPSNTAGSWPVWADGLGRPVLSRHALGAGAYYQLRTRLHPAWSELAESPELPAQLLKLLQPAPTETPGRPTLNEALARYDQRVLDPAQLPAAVRRPAPGAASKATLPPPATFRAIDLRPWLVLLAGLLFALERLLAYRRETRALPSVA